MPFIWDQKCQEAFDELKFCLCNKPVLAFPRGGRQFIIDVDASEHAFGGVLMQEGDDKQVHPIAYFSDTVQKSQQNWSITTKEAFALVLAVRHWYVYLAGNRFFLNSDHNPLVYLRKQKDPRGKFGRWILELEEFDYTINYLPGTDNVKADTMSRIKAASLIQPSPNFDEKIYAVNIQNFMSQIAEEQSVDPIISRVLNCISNEEPVMQGRFKRIHTQTGY